MCTIITVGRLGIDVITNPAGDVGVEQTEEEIEVETQQKLKDMEMAVLEAKMDEEELGLQMRDADDLDSLGSDERVDAMLQMTGAAHDGMGGTFGHDPSMPMMPMMPTSGAGFGADQYQCQQHPQAFDLQLMPPEMSRPSAPPFVDEFGADEPYQYDYPPLRHPRQHMPPPAPAMQRFASRPPPSAPSAPPFGDERHADTGSYHSHHHRAAPAGRRPFAHNPRPDAHPYPGQSDTHQAHLGADSCRNDRHDHQPNGLADASPSERLELFRAMRARLQPSVARGGAQDDGGAWLRDMAVGGPMNEAGPRPAAVPGRDYLERMKQARRRATQAAFD
jgi:hypothetical protein